MYRTSLVRLLIITVLMSSLAAMVILPRAAHVQAADGPAHLVKDINTTQLTDTDSFQFFTSVSNLLFFVADTPANGENLWRSDGTTAGTFMLTNIPQPQNTIITSLSAVGNTLFFITGPANDEGGRRPGALWASDGTVAGTRRITQFTPCGFYAAAGTTFYFDATVGTNGCELWKSDGTATGTVRVADLQPGVVGSSTNVAASIGTTLFFTANDSANSMALWRTDGTLGSTVRLTSVAATDYMSNVAVIQNTLFFTLGDATLDPTLWKSDGTPEGTMQIASFQTSRVNTGPINLTVVGSTLFFAVGNSEVGASLWKSDGTSGGTMQVAAIHPPEYGSGPSKLYALGDTLFFDADDGSTGSELWKSDGTAAGTRLVKDINPSFESEGFFNSSNPSGFVGVGHTLFFVANNTTTGSGIWRTDGTAAGTQLAIAGTVSNLRVFKNKLYFERREGDTSIYHLWSANPEPGTPAPVSTIVSAGDTMQIVGSNIFFAGNTNATIQAGWSNVPELWKTDGTSSGTGLVKTFATKSSYPTALTTFKGQLFFGATGGAQGNGLWQSDGSAQHTALVKGEETYGFRYPQELAVANNTLFIGSTDTRPYLWKSDGTAQSTTVLTDAYNSWRQSQFTPAGNKLFFTTQYGSHLWVSDGTVLGTQPIANTSDFGVLGNTVLFEGSGGVSTLWKSDGTPGGTAKIADFGADVVGTSDFTPVGTTMFFTLYSRATGDELWKSDGTTTGTVRVAVGNAIHLTAMENTLFFARDVGTGFELWKSDGTTAGTVRVSDALFRYPNENSTVAPFTAVGDGVFFVAYDPADGLELWRSDGTAAGTRLVKDINPGPDSSQAINLTNIDGRLLFSAYDPAHGTELWQSNGTAAGTTLVQDINPGIGNSNPQDFTVVGDQIFFQAFTPDAGAELWAMPVSALVAPAPVSNLTPTSVATTTTSTPSVTATTMSTKTPSSTSIPSMVPTNTMLSTYTATAMQTATPTVSDSATSTSSTALSTALPSAPSATSTATSPTSGAAKEPSPVYPATLLPLATSSAVVSTATPTPQTFTGNISAATGGTVSTLDGSITLTFPPGAVSSDVAVTFTVPVPTPHSLPAGQAVVQSFALNAVNNVGTPITQFARPYTLTIHYTDAQLSAAGTSSSRTLNLAYWNSNGWVNILPCAGCTVDTTAHTLTVQLDHFTDFAVIGSTSAVYLPLTTR